MSDNENSGNNASPKFTERELQLLGWAMQSLKSGPPDVRLPSPPSRRMSLTFSDRLRETSCFCWYGQSSLC
ncbi:hypothetical protein BKA66DRAFT_452173 [Pyrenochaeta sp. MPI-SDFR-AT-0127]|nr:hypothetical protein BKA66DRAFT_452173 [Pyrenochaeta sp. MPI-SDFR-AT-0127]